MRIIEKGDIEMRRMREAQQRGFEEGQQALRKGQEALRKGQQALREKVAGEAQSKALEVMPEELKVLYIKTLAAQSLVGGKVDPKKVADIYLFMSQIDLQADSRGQIRQFLESGEAALADVLRLASKTVVRSRSGRDEIAFSLVKDMVRISRVGEGRRRSSARA